MQNVESYKVITALNIMCVHTHRKYEANVNLSSHYVSDGTTLAVWWIVKCSKANADICMRTYKGVCSFYRNIIVWNTLIRRLLFPLTIYPQHLSEQYVHQSIFLAAVHSVSWMQRSWCRLCSPHLLTPTTTSPVFYST